MRISEAIITVRECAFAFKIIIYREQTTTV